MSKIKNGGLDQYGAEPFEQQQFRTAGVEGVKLAPKELRFNKSCKNLNGRHSLSQDKLTEPMPPFSFVLQLVYVYTPTLTSSAIEYNTG